MIWPNNIPIGSVKVASLNPAYKNEANNLKVFISEIPAHRWEITIRTIALNVTEQRQFWGWINSLGGMTGNFDVELPLYSQARGLAYGLPVSNGGVAGSKQINITNCPASVINWLMMGDYVRFGNHSKVYQVAADVDTDSNGDAALVLTNRLIMDVTAGVAATVNDVPFTLMLRNDIQEFSVDPEKYVVFELDCIEVL